jgi:hypothetical protein
VPKTLPKQLDAIAPKSAEKRRRRCGRTLAQVTISHRKSHKIKTDRDLQSQNGSRSAQC